MKKILLMAAILILIPATALSQQVCNNRETMIKLLEEKYNEYPKGISTTSTGLLIERYESLNRKSWTIVVTHPQTKISCVMFNGEDWTELKLNWKESYERNLRF